MGTSNTTTLLGRRALVRESIERQDDDGASHGLVGRLERLCRGAAEHLGLTGAAVNLMSPTGSDGVVAASDERCKNLVEMQFTTGQGPGPDAFDLRRPVLAPDLAAAEEHRWQGYASMALGAGVRSAFAFPLQVGPTRLGVLDLFGEVPEMPDEEQLAVALTFAQMATELLLDGRLTTAEGELAPDVGSALSYRVEIYQAQGMLTVWLGVGLPEAMVRMRATAFEQGRTLIELAHDIIAGCSLVECEI
jgi:hypothetical protein